jgi:phage FluMu protein Com
LVDLRCDTCGKSFQMPVLADFHVDGDIEKYYACPRCLTEVREVAENKKEGTGISMSTGKPEKRVRKLDIVVCKHFLGYLKKRKKSEPIPDECLVCDKMIECLLR